MQFGVTRELSTLSHQGLLIQHLQHLFPGKTIKNAKKEVSMRDPATGALLEVDVFVPHLRIGFEFQDSYHYVTTWYHQLTRSKIDQKDHMKASMLHHRGLDLLAIPCWWDGLLESLADAIHFYRPDIFPSYASQQSAIPLNPPFGYFQDIAIPNVGELMLASFPHEAQFNKIFSPSAWWMGEKFDGIRCCWDPESCELFSRRGKTISLSDPFSSLLPKNATVDGELCFGRGQFSLIYKFLKESNDFIYWDQLRIIAFDVPTIDFDTWFYEDRYSLLLSNIPQDHPYVVNVPRVLCENSTHMEIFVQDIIDKGGEGIILQKINSSYEHGRSHLLMKLKTALGDQEAIVVKKENDGSLLLKLPSGKEFSVPPSDIHLTPTHLSPPASSLFLDPSLSLPLPSAPSSSPSPSPSSLLPPSPSIIKPGDIVSFSYEIQSRRDVPAKPQVHRVREDVEWEDVVKEYYKERKYLGDTSLVEGFTAQPQRHWTHKKMRLFLEKLAYKLNLDPLAPRTWYQYITYDTIRRLKGGSAILGKFKGGYFATLSSLFPEINLDPTKFKIKRYSWKDIRSRRKFFEMYAKRRRFDPLVPENWYRQSTEAILSEKGAVRAVGYHNYSVTQALMDLFPNIGLEEAKFKLYRSIHNRRKFFENFAQQKGFDPLIPSNWYKQPKEDIMLRRGANKILAFHRNRISTALIDLFPDVSFEKSKFGNKKEPVKKLSEIPIKLFFDMYARANRFDPLNAANWYSQKFANILSYKGGSMIKVKYYGRVSNALMDAYPDIGLNKAILNRSWEPSTVRAISVA